MEELQSYRNLVKDIIETLDGRDNSVKKWIEEQVEEIESLVAAQLKGLSDED